MTDDMVDADKGSLPAPAISLVLPVYNGERYLAEALDSIFAQSFTDFELIAVDDCSSDATPRILADYAARHPNMRVMRNAQNAKLPATLNNGFREARGAWFSWTSDDNTLDPDMLTRLYAAAQAGDADIYYADFRFIHADGEVTGSCRAGEPHEIVVGNPIGCCFLYRREVDEALGGYDEALFGVEDYDFWLRAERAGFHFQTIHEELYSYRRHGGSLTSTRAKHIYGLSGPIMLESIEQLPKSPWRAFAYLNLATRDPYHLRWGLLARAWRDHPPTVMGNLRKVASWLRFALSVRLGRS